MEIDPLWEFRLFIRNGNKPTGLTQYHKNIVLPLMYKYRKYIEKSILNTFNELQPKLDEKLQDYTVDFAVILKDKSKQNKCWIDNEISDEKVSYISVRSCVGSCRLCRYRCVSCSTFLVGF